MPAGGRGGRIIGQVTLDYIIRIGEQGEAAEVDLHEVFEENEESGTDEEKAPGADEAQRVRLLSFTTKLTKLRGSSNTPDIGAPRHRPPMS